MERPSPSEYAPFYHGYVTLVSDGPLERNLRQQLSDTDSLLGGLSDAAAAHRYAPGKWSIKEVLGHIIDAERIFAYRLLAIARGETRSLPGFDENAYAAVSNAHLRRIEDLVREYRAVRLSSIELVQSLREEDLVRQGISNENPITARAIAFIIAGHERHHVQILRERYGL